ncbi:MAG: extracellular solute-binding protein [Paenibacillaceae bacterium]
MKNIGKYGLLGWLSIWMLLLSSCVNSDSLNNDGNGSSSNRFELTIMANLHTQEVPSSKIEMVLEQMTNTDLHIQWVPDGHYEEKLKAAFAMGTLPQAVYLKNQDSFAMFKDAIRDGQFWEIGPYLEQFENLSKLKANVLQNTSVDGRIYSLYQERSLSRQGVIYRKDWADHLGISTPRTTEDLFEMAKQFTENDPDQDGLHNTIGLADRSDLIYGAFKTVSSYYETPNNWGVNNGQLLPEFMFQSYIDTMDFFKRIYEKGYINQDFPVTSKINQLALIKNGTAGIYIGSMGDVDSLYYDAIELNPNIEFAVSNRISKQGGKEGIWSIPGYGTIVLFPRTAIKDETELMKVLSFFDKLMSTEASNLIVWGIEGEHYQISAEQQADTSIVAYDVKDREVKPYEALEIGGPDTNGRYEGNFAYAVKERADELVRDNESMLIDDPTAPLDSETNNEMGLGLQNIIDDATYLYILGEIDGSGFDKAIRSWKEQGGDQVIKQFNDAWLEVQ